METIPWSLILYLSWISTHQVTCEQVNVAQGKPTRQGQDSYDPLGLSGLATDGNLDPYWVGGSCAATKSVASAETSAWWWVDLEAEYSISRVVIINRLDCCPDRLRDFNVGVSTSEPALPLTTASFQTCFTHVGVETGNASITCSTPSRGRFVIIQIPGSSQTLTLCEVLVYTDIVTTDAPTTEGPTTETQTTEVPTTTGQTTEGQTTEGQTTESPATSVRTTEISTIKEDTTIGSFETSGLPSIYSTADYTTTLEYSTSQVVTTHTFDISVPGTSTINVEGPTTTLLPWREPKVICAVYPRAEHASIQHQAYLNGDFLLTYVCNPGHQWSNGEQSQTFTCSDQGIWSNTSPGCQEATCPEIELTNGTSRSTESRGFNVSVTYMCSLGSTFADGSHSRELFCGEGGEWHGAVSPCQEISCPVIDLNNTGVVSASCSTLGCTAQVRCNPGYVTFSGSDVTHLLCTATGQWNSPLPYCIASFSCPPVPYVPNSSLKLVKHNAGSVVARIRCSKGYRYKDGSKVRKYTCTGSWPYDQLHQCYLVTCKALSQVSHATKDTDLAIYETEVTLTCDPGYKVSGIGNQTLTEQVVLCQENSTWSYLPKPCTNIICDPAPIIGNATLLNDTVPDYYPWDAIRYQCDTGLRFQDGGKFKTLECGFLGAWPLSDDVCQTGRCPRPSSVGFSLSSPVNASIGGKVTFTCLEGYTFPNSSITMTTECNANLTWDQMYASCEEIHCPALSADGTLSWNTTDTIYGTAAGASCITGYIVQGGLAGGTICSLGGAWEPTETDVTCELLRCPHISMPMYSYPDRVFTDLYGTTITITCLTGYTFTRGQQWKVLECLATGLWSDTLSDCQPVTCPGLPSWANIEVDTVDNKYSTVANVTCQQGYAFDDKVPFKVTECQQSGDWSVTIEGCISITEDDLGDIGTEEAPSGPVIGTAVAAVFISLLVCIALLDVITVFAFCRGGGSRYVELHTQKKSARNNKRIILK